MSLYDKLDEAEDEIDYTFPFKRKKYVNYHAPREPLISEPWKSREEGGQGSKKYRYSCNRISSKCVGISRRRIGRGGRYVDRSNNFLKLCFLIDRTSVFIFKVF